MSSVFDQDVLGRLQGLTVRGTGTGPLPPTRRIVCNLDQYEVVLAVTEDDRVVGVVEVREKKDFRSVRQKIASTGHFDIEQFINE
jgi:hypothetical protein